MSTDVIVIGGGLFGSVIAAAVRDSGGTVIILDAKLPGAGSAAAACLMKPSWLSGIKKEADIGLDYLDHLYRIQNVTFSTAVADADVFWIPPTTIIKPGMVTQERVTELARGVVHCESGNVYEARKIVLAVGVWTNKFIDKISVSTLHGTALRYPGQVEKPRISIWAPYKQSVSFNISEEEVWFGDGTSVKYWDEDKYVPRMVKHAGQHDLTGGHDTIYGMRPKVKDPGGWFEEVQDDIWVATGGAKNGTALAGYFAKRFIEESL